MGNKAYSNEQRAAFLELASEIGITRAMRQLKYPASWRTGQMWMNAAGIEIPLDEIKAQAKAHHDWYTSEEMLLVAQEGVMRVHLELQQTNLDPDQHKKLSEAFQKYANTWLLLQGKANNINETRTRDSIDVSLMELINEENMRNSEIEKGVESA